MIEGLDEALTDQALLKRAMCDAATAMSRYFTAGRSTREAIDTFERLRSQFDQARIDRPEILRRRSDA